MVIFLFLGWVLFGVVFRFFGPSLGGELLLPLADKVVMPALLLADVVVEDRLDLLVVVVLFLFLLVARWPSLRRGGRERGGQLLLVVVSGVLALVLGVGGLDGELLVLPHGGVGVGLVLATVAIAMIMTLTIAAVSVALAIASAVTAMSVAIASAVTSAVSVASLLLSALGGLAASPVLALLPVLALGALLGGVELAVLVVALLPELVPVESALVLRALELLALAAPVKALVTPKFLVIAPVVVGIVELGLLAVFVFVVRVFESFRLVSLIVVALFPVLGSLMALQMETEIRHCYCRSKVGQINYHFSTMLANYECINSTIGSIL